MAAANIIPIIPPRLPISLEVTLAVDNKSSLDLSPGSPTSHISVSGIVQKAPEAVKAGVSDGQGGIYEVIKGTTPAALESASLYSFEDSDYVVVFLVNHDSEGKDLTKVAFLHSKKVDAKAIQKILTDSRYTDEAFFSFQKPNNTHVYNLKVTSDFIKITDGINHEAVFTVEEQLPTDTVVKEIPVNSSVDNTQSQLNLTPIDTVTLDGHLVSDALAVKSGASGSGGSWKTEDPYLIQGLGQVLKPDIAAGAFYDYGVKGHALVFALARWSNGKTETRVAAWQLDGKKPNARIVETVLNDARFSDSAKILIFPENPLKGPVRTVTITSKIETEIFGADETYIAQFTLVG